MEKSLKSLIDKYELKSIPAAQYSPLVLAYIGDSVFDVIVKSILVSRSNAPVNVLNKRASFLVRAVAQSKMVDIIMPLLTEKEANIYRRGHNSKPGTTAKNASVADYMRATGFEAVIGYLYLNDEDERLMELASAAIEGIENGKQ